VTVPCRICGQELSRTFVDLGMSPPCEDLLTAQRLHEPEVFYPLHVRICDRCLLVQLPNVIPPEEIFTDSYAYFSSFSTSWVEHARRYSEEMIQRLGLGPSSMVMEVASNDGYLLQHFVTAGIPVLGIDPAGNTADAAIAKGVPTEKVFLGEQTALDLTQRHGQADLIAANNVFAHVPDLHDFVTGLATLLAPTGTLTLEFPHLQRLIEQRQYDTIYHEHFSYYTLLTAARALALADLVVEDADELPSHGGSLRLVVRHRAAAGTPTAAVAGILQREAAAGLHTIEGHAGFAEQVATVKADLLDFLISARREGKTVAGYGAPGKGNTLLNHCGVRGDLLPYTVDLNPGKHAMFLPGSLIPIHSPDRLAETRPDYILILPWNLRREIGEQLAYAREWGARLVTAIPRLDVW